MLFQSQNKKCAICGDTSKNESKDMCVDHCHKTGKVRAILCRRCNSALGLFKEDKEILQEAIKYIDKNRV